MKKAIIFVIMLFACQAVQALDYVDEIVLLDGSHIRQCRLADKSIHYCTEEDAFNARKAQAHPELLPQSQNTQNAITPNTVIQGIGTTASNVSNTIYDIRSVWHSLGQYW